MKSVMVEKQIIDLPVIRVGNLVKLDVGKYDAKTKMYVVLVTHADGDNFQGVIVYSENEDVHTMRVGYSTSCFISDSFVQFNGTITLEV